MVISFLLKECCFHPHFPQIPHSVSENSAFYKCYWIRVRGRGNLKRKMRGKGSSKVRKKCKKEKKNRMEGNEKAKLLLPEVHPAHPGSRMSLTRLQCDLKESNAIYNWTLPSTPALIGEMLAWIGKTLNENAYSSCPSLSQSPNLLLLHNFFSHSPLIIF